MNYEAVIGLEVHVQIKTHSKVFTRVGTGYGREPNTLTDPVVLGLPGALPVMNKAALDAIIKAGLILGCEIAPLCKWDRKNYFYPDSPKNYQISQYDQPLAEHGFVEVNVGGVANVIRAFVPAMITRGTGVIVNLSSGWGRSVSPEVAPYCASKWAIEGLTQALAAELPAGMAAVPLNPGVIDTDMLRQCWSDAASAYPKAGAWAKVAAPFILGLKAEHNGQSLSVGGDAE